MPTWRAIATRGACWRLPSRCWNGWRITFSKYRPMPSDAVKRKIVQVLRKEFSGDQDKVVVRDGWKDLLHLYVVSTKFRRKDLRQKVDMIADILTSSLQPDEWGRVSLMVGLTPAEAKRYWPAVPGLNGR